MCSAQVSPRYTICRGCAVIARQLGGDLVPVLPVRVAPRGAPLHRLLVAYKAAPSTFVRTEAAKRLSCALADFLARHQGQLDPAGRPVQLLATVPSTGPGRPSWHGAHPLVAVVEAACGPLERGERPSGWSAVPLERGPGELGHLRAAPDAYRVRDPATACLRPRAPLIVVDDLYTSGAHAQSAARALRDAGHDVVAVVPIGRLVRASDPRAAADDPLAATTSAWSAGEPAGTRAAGDVAPGRAA